LRALEGKLAESFNELKRRRIFEKPRPKAFIAADHDSVKGRGESLSVRKKDLIPRFDHPEPCVSSKVGDRKPLLTNEPNTEQ
jgi:hypothetical protein